MIAPGLGWPQRQRGRGRRPGKAGQGRARLGARQGMATGETGRRGGTRRQEPTLGSVNHVRLCATRPSFSRCRLSRLGRLGAPRRGGCRPAGRPVEQGGASFFLLVFRSFWLGASALAGVSGPGPVGACSTRQGLLAQLASCARADEDGFDVHWRGVGVGSLSAWEECDWEGRARRPRDGVDRFGGEGVWGMELMGDGAYGCWRGCGAGHMYNAHVCAVRACAVRACVFACGRGRETVGGGGRWAYVRERCVCVSVRCTCIHT